MKKKRRKYATQRKLRSKQLKKVKRLKPRIKSWVKSQRKEPKKVTEKQMSPKGKKEKILTLKEFECCDYNERFRILFEAVFGVSDKD